MMFIPLTKIEKNPDLPLNELFKECSPVFRIMECSDDPHHSYLRSSDETPR